MTPRQLLDNIAWNSLCGARAARALDESMGFLDHQELTTRVVSRGGWA